MGCCGSNNSLAAKVNRYQGSPSVTGYAVDMPDNRVLTYLTRAEAEAARESFAVEKPVREVLGWK